MALRIKGLGLAIEQRRGIDCLFMREPHRRPAGSPNRPFSSGRGLCLIARRLREKAAPRLLYPTFRARSLGAPAGILERVVERPPPGRTEPAPPRVAPGVPPIAIEELQENDRRAKHRQYAIE